MSDGRSVQTINVTALESLADWLVYARATVNTTPNTWRSKSLVAMLPVVEWFVDRADHDRTELLKRVRKAYPFGARSNYPYKAWLNEVQTLRVALLDSKATWEQYDVIKVADDMVQLGRIDEAKELLEQEAPDMLGRVCPVCGRMRGSPCRDVQTPSYDAAERNQTSLFVVVPQNPEAQATFRNATAALRYAANFEERIIPHEARILPKTPRTS